jgi:hypothetical protein
MVNKEKVLQTVQAVPDSASWSEITDALFLMVSREGSVAELTNLYRGQLTPADLKEYEQPRFEVRLDDVIAELEKLHAGGTAG